MRISAVTAEILPPARKPSRLLETVVANPMSAYPEYYQRRSSWIGPAHQALLVTVATDEGVTGYGAGAGGPVGKEIIEGHLQSLLLGREAFDVELLWDQMWRSTLPYGRKGVAIHAISGVDIAIWDAIGRARNEPVWRLIGGRTKQHLPVYVTGNDTELYHKLGFTRNKLAIPYGPVDGWEGMKKNLALIERTRDILGPDGEIMLDCYMAWDVEYTLRMAELVQPYRVRWIEECLPPDDIDGYAEIRQKVQHTAIAGGEHEYTRWGQLELLKRRAVDILQPDVQWVGGLSELRKVVAIASAFNVPVIQHGGGMSAADLNVAVSSVNVPMAECQISADPDEYPAFWRGLPQPEAGFIDAPTGPGLGVEPDWDVIEAHRSSQLHRDGAIHSPRR